MPAELVRAVTPDGVTLDGAWQRATPGALALDAACLVHGTGSNFYASTFMEMLASNSWFDGSSAAAISA